MLRASRRERYARRFSTTLAERFDVPPEQVLFADGRVRADGRSMSMAEIAREMIARGPETSGSI